MDALTLSTRTLRLAVIAALMLCAQVLAATHEFEHEAGGEPDVCSTCTIAGGLKHITVAPDASVTLAPLPVAFAVVDVPLLTDLGTPSPEARAPPTDS